MNQDRWLGIYKVLEECGELTTVLGKLGPYPDGNHPDGAGNLVDRMQDELADVIAASTYFAKKNGLDVAYINARVAKKLATYEEWVLTGIPL
jgi:NTP pyrophosphatase (non-canonical NTP hydrolase)